jgi:hypothetical protein
MKEGDEILSDDGTVAVAQTGEVGALLAGLFALNLPQTHTCPSETFTNLHDLPR